MSKITFIILLYFIPVSVAAQNSAFIIQQNGLLDSETNLVQIGESNLLTGFVTDNNFVAAYQYSNAGINNLNVMQLGSTKQKEIILSQEALSNNTGILKQENGSHTLLIKEISTNGSNSANITQSNGSGYITIEQKAFLNNIIPSAENTVMNNPNGYPGIYQEGYNNYIIGASEVNIPAIGSIAIPRPDLPAQQISKKGENWLEIWQTGGFNVVALHQEAEKDNKALIHQNNGLNLAIVFQRAVDSNYVLIEQAGGMASYVYQNGGLNNEAIIRQY
jgi:hypothetical protein